MPKHGEFMFQYKYILKNKKTEQTHVNREVQFYI